MLAQKKTSTKKLAIYILIIVLMFGGTAFLLLKNNKSSNQGVDNDSTVLNNSDIADIVAEEASDQTNQLETGNNQIENSSETDLTIFNSEKFKALKENVLIPREKTVPGKRNPFQPDNKFIP